MSAELLIAVVTGVGFLVGLLLIGCYIAFRKNPSPVPPEAMFIFRVVLAVAASGFAAALPGFFQIEGRLLSFSVRAAGSLAVFLLVYRVNPPERFEKKPPKLKKSDTAVGVVEHIERKQSNLFGSRIVVLSLGLMAILAAGIWYWNKHKPQPLAKGDVIVLADFTNTTGDSAFDDSLKQALGIQLEQSPFVTVLSDQKLRSTLRLMNRNPADELSREVAREVCLRTKSKVTLMGYIVTNKEGYNLILKALDCQTGRIVASADSDAENRDGVLKALGDAGNQLRKNLGEPPDWVEQFNKPIERATSSSIDAMKAFAQGQKASFVASTGLFAPNGLPFYGRAVELDHSFALAYFYLGIIYNNQAQEKLARENLTKAYELRDRVGERARYKIETDYYSIVTGELEKSTRSFEQWAHDYPDDFAPHANLAFSYNVLGKYEKAIRESSVALKLMPGGPPSYWHLINAYISLDRLEEAEASIKEMDTSRPSTLTVHECRYFLAFLRKDVGAMQTQVMEMKGKPGEDLLLLAESNSEAYFGHLAKARDFLERAMKLTSDRDKVALLRAKDSLRESEFGNTFQARKEIDEALRLSSDSDVQVVGALALARAGEPGKAKDLVDKLEQEFPLDTMVQNYWLPTIRAAIELDRGNPEESVKLLQVASPYDLAKPALFDLATLYPVYLRGEAYLKAGFAEDAATEFRKILDHPGMILNFPLAAITHLQLGRAYVAQGDTPKGRAAYEGFLELWKTADVEIHVLKQAKSEYARL